MNDKENLNTNNLSENGKSQDYGNAVTQNKNVFIMKNEKGEQVECEVMMTIASDEFNSNYMIYTDHTMTDDGNINT